MNAKKIAANFSNASIKMMIRSQLHKIEQNKGNPSGQAYKKAAKLLTRYQAAYAIKNGELYIP